MSKIEFKRGDGVTHYFTMPVSSWSAGGTLFFTAKPAVDDDSSDLAAVINQSFSDSVVSNDVDASGNAVKKYTCYFPPAATNSITSSGSKKADYLGEFQWVSSTGVPSTFPGNDKFLDCIVYFDLRRATT